MKIIVTRHLQIRGLWGKKDVEDMFVEILNNGVIKVGHGAEKYTYPDCSLIFDGKTARLSAEETKTLANGDKPLLDVILPKVVGMFPINRVSPNYYGRVTQASSPVSSSTSGTQSWATNRDGSSDWSPLIDMKIIVTRHLQIRGLSGKKDVEDMFVEILNNGVIKVGHGAEKYTYPDCSLIFDGKTARLSAEETKTLANGDKPLLDVILPKVVEMFPINRVIR